MNKIAGKKSKWKIVEKEFVQGKDVSQNDAWKLILLSDFFPKVSHYVYISDLIIKKNLRAPRPLRTLLMIIVIHPPRMMKKKRVMKMVELKRLKRKET